MYSLASHFLNKGCLKFLFLFSNTSLQSQSLNTLIQNTVLYLFVFHAPNIMPETQYLFSKTLMNEAPKWPLYDSDKGKR